MMTGSWIFLALIVAFTQAGLSLVSEHFKVKAVHLLVWLRIFAVGALLPVTFFVPWPTDPLFYGLVAVTAFIFVYCDVISFGMIAKNGAGTVSRIQSLVAITAFIVWTAISPHLFGEYLASPFRSAGIVAAIIGATYFAMRMRRRCVISQETLRVMIGPIVMAAIGIAISKHAVQLTAPLSGAVYYTLVQGSLMLVIYAFILLFRPLSSRIQHFGMESAFTTKKAVMAGACGAALHIVHMLCKYMAYAWVENPAYVAVIGLTSPLWILLFYKLVKRQEKADVLSGLGIVFCAVLLIIFTQF